MLASSGFGLKLWNHEPNIQLVKEYPIIGNASGQLGRINNFAVKSDSTQIASVIENDSINLLSLETHIQLDLKDSINTNFCTYDSSGKYLATGNANGFLEIYDVKSQTLKKRHWKVDNSNCVKCLSYSNNNRFVAIGSSNGSINLFNTLQNTMGKPWVHPKSRHAPMVNAVQYPAQSPNLASAYDDGSIILWDCSREQPICTFQAHKSPCTSVVISPLNAILMTSGGLDSSFFMYDISYKKVIRQFNCKSGITSLDILKNGWTMVAGTLDGYIHMYDLRNTETSLFSEKAHDTSVSCVKFISNLVAPGTMTANKENFKGNYLTSTINSNSNTHSSSNDQTIKRSNSYNNQELSNIHNIYSPEKGYNSNSTASLNQQSTNQFATGGEFILHKKQSTSIVSLNQTPAPANSTVANPSEFKLDLRANFAPKSKIRANEIYSPLSGNSKSITNNNLQKNLEVSASISTIKPSQTIEQEQLKKPSPFINLRTITQSNNSIEQPTVINNKLEFDMEVDHVENTPAAVSVENSSPLKGVDQLRDVKDQLRDVRDEIEDLKDEMKSEMFRFKAEMFKEFMHNKADMKKYFEFYSPNEALMNENIKLKDENSRLKKLF